MIRLLKSVHGWLGILVLPWIILIGLSGLYLNHYKLIYPLLPAPTYDEARFDAWPAPLPVDVVGARAIASRVFPNDKFELKPGKRYHNRDVITLQGQSGRVIVTTASGHYWVKTWFTRRTYDPAGKLLDTKIYWGAAIRALHARGWLYSTFGTWLADITAGAMILFGLSGIFLFLASRIGRGKTGKPPGEIKVARRNIPRPQRIRLKE